jgi:hypothetical protein
MRPGHTSLPRLGFAQGASSVGPLTMSTSPISSWGEGFARDSAPETLQVNMGKPCNRACHHCRNVGNHLTTNRILKGSDTSGRREARCHSLNHFAQPTTESPGAVGARTEPYRSSDARPKQGITEHENKEIGGSEQRLFQLRGPSSFVVRSANPASMHSFGRRLKDARLHCPVALSGKNQPGQQARHSTARSDLVKALENALDVRFFRARPSLEELRLKPCDAPQDHRFNQPLAATKVM